LSENGLFKNDPDTRKNSSHNNTNNHDNNNDNIKNENQNRIASMRCSTVSFLISSQQEKKNDATTLKNHV